MTHFVHSVLVSQTMMLASRATILTELVSSWSALPIFARPLAGWAQSWTVRFGSALASRVQRWVLSFAYSALASRVQRRVLSFGYSVLASRTKRVPLVWTRVTRAISLQRLASQATSWAERCACSTLAWS